MPQNDTIRKWHVYLFGISYRIKKNISYQIHSKFTTLLRKTLKYYDLSILLAVLKFTSLNTEC